MGQRLNIEIKKDDKVLANAYYHWAGYTGCALELTEQVINGLNTETSTNDVLKAIRLLELTGAGLTDSELQNLDESFKDLKFKNCIDRNNGLIAISEKGIKETESWEEARVEIHLDTKDIILNIYHIIDHNDLDDEEKCLYFETFDFIHNARNCKFEDFETLKNIIFKNLENDMYGIRVQGEYVSFIQ